MAISALIQDSAALPLAIERPHVPELTVSVDVVDDPTPLRTDWRALAAASRNVFATWEWHATWRSTIGRSADTSYFVVRTSAGTTIAIVPIVRERRGLLRVLRFSAHGVGDALGPICHPAHRSVVAATIARALADRRGEDLLVAERLPGDQGWPEMLGGRELRREASPVFDMRHPSWDDVMASLSGTLRREIRRKDRALVRDHAVNVRYTRSPDELDRDLDLLFELHRARWAGASSFEPRAAFHRAFARTALEQGWLELSFLEIDGRPAAALYDFRMGDVQAHYNSGRDPSFRDTSPGLVLRARVLETAFAEGVREYHFLRGDEPYKFRFATSDPGVVTVGVARTAVGRGTLAAFDEVLRRPRVWSLVRRLR